jgi:alkylation response protein AidB-like acyl-CoA dehydrogenase
VGFCSLYCLSQYAPGSKGANKIIGDFTGDMKFEDIHGPLTEGDDVVKIAQNFSEELLARASEFEEQGFVSQDVADRLARLGLFRLCNPPDYGGPGRSPTDYARLVETLSRYDGSTGWIVFIGITSALAACKLSAETVSGILSAPDAITAGVFAPMGRAVACERDGEKGFRLNGQWQWGSGSRNADYISGGGFVVDDTGDIVKQPDGTPDQRSFLMPIADVELLDTWHVAGLKGTGSTDFLATGVFVPDYMTANPFEQRDFSHPIHSFPLFAALGIGIGAVALGLAAACRDEFLSLAGHKTPQGSARTLAMKPATHRRVAEATAKLRSARLYFYDAVEKAWELAVNGEGISIETRADLRLSNTHAVTTAAEIIDSLYTLAGGTSVYLKSPIQRHFRDVHVATQHMMVNEATLELVGRIQLGQETNVSLL